jgi:hypothetical protein
MNRKGDFGLVIGNDPVGKIIRKMEDWEKAGRRLNVDGFAIYSHAFVIVDYDGTIIEAEPGGARYGNVSEYGELGTGWVSSNWNLTEDQRDTIADNARLLLGTGYSFLDYVSLALLRLHIRPRFVVRYVAHTGHMICSQQVDEIYTTSLLHMFDDGRFPGDVTPQDLSAVLNGPLVHPSKRK